MRVDRRAEQRGDGLGRLERVFHDALGDAQDGAVRRKAEQRRELAGANHFGPRYDELNRQRLGQLLARNDDLRVGRVDGRNTVSQGLEGETRLGEDGGGYRSNQLHAVDPASDRDRPAGKTRCLEEGEALRREAVEALEQLRGRERLSKGDVGILCDRAQPHAETCAEGDDRAGAEALREVDREARAASDTGQHGRDVDLALQRHRAELGEADAELLRVALAEVVRLEASLDAGLRGDAGAGLGEGRRGFECAEAGEGVYAVVAHLLHVAGDAAVVADELALVGERVGHVGVVHLCAEGLAAGRAEPVDHRLAVFLEQEAILEAHIDVVPWQMGVGGERCEEETALDAVLRLPLRERLLPGGPVEVLVPAVEAGAEPPGEFEQVARAVVAAREDALDVASAVLVFADVDVGAAGAVEDEPLLAADLIHAVHCTPLEGGVGLGHMARDGNGDVDGALVAAADLVGLSAHLHDAEKILVGLGRKTDHEVEFDALPALGEDPVAGGEDVFFADVLVDDVAHTLRARFGREGEAGGLHAGDIVEQFIGEAVGAQRRDAERHLHRPELLHDALDEGRNAGVVGGGERGDGGLIVAAFLDGGDEGLDDLFGVSLPHGTVDHAGLAEAAALGAAARNLHRHAVEDGLSDGHG